VGVPKMVSKKFFRLFKISIKALLLILFVVCGVAAITLYAVTGNPYRVTLTRPIAIVFSYTIVAIVMIIYYNFNSHSIQPQGLIHCRIMGINTLSLFFGIDGITLGFLIIVVLIIPFCLVSS
jgi:NADH:ubiquinone oxidoreductase subunit 4 (subunit M)